MRPIEIMAPGSLTPNIFLLRHRMIGDVRMRQFHGKTQTHCIRAVCRPTAFSKQSPDTAAAQNLGGWLLPVLVFMSGQRLQRGCPDRLVP